MADQEVASDDFNGTDGDVLEVYDSTNWQNQGTGGQIMRLAIFDPAGEEDVYSKSSGRIGFAYYKTGSWDVDQYAKATITAMDSGEAANIGIGVRCSNSETKTGYAFVARNWTSNPGYFLERVVAESATVLDSDGTTPSTGEVLRLEAVGTSPTLLKVSTDGSPLGSIDDPYSDAANSELTTAGSAGVFADGSSFTTIRLDDWSGGNVVAAPSGRIMSSLVGGGGLAGAGGIAGQSGGLAG